MAIMSKLGHKFNKNSHVGLEQPIELASNDFLSFVCLLFKIPQRSLLLFSKQ